MEKASGETPFTAIVGQEELKEALLASVTDDALDGLLVRGEKGTAKSTTVRGLADLLPAQRAVADCPYGCPPDGSSRQCQTCRDREDPPVEQRSVPLVTLPLGASRERVVGSLSVADALDGSHEFEPGLLAQANRGILYVDEVNLLDDHLVDVLLDAAASGINRVERDGVSRTHPADFTLVGTMNPEEGELRPQLRDRFALQATVEGCTDVDDRVTIVRQALGEHRDDVDSPEQVRERIVGARKRLAAVEITDDQLADIATLCKSAGVEGHRGDIAIARAARTFAALSGRSAVLETDLEQAASLALPHRMKSRPFEDGGDADEVIDEHFDGEGSENEDETDDESSRATGDDGSKSDGPDDDSDSETGDPEDTNSAIEEEGGSDTDAADGGGPDEAEDNSRDESGRDGSDDGGDGSSRPTPAGADGTGEEGHEASEGDGGTEDTDDGPGDSDDRNPATPLVPGQSCDTVDPGESVTPETPDPDVGCSDDSTSGAHIGMSPTAGGTGARIRTEPTRDSEAVDGLATVRAAASRGATSPDTRDLRQSIRMTGAERLVVFAVDASASMRPAMKTAKATVLELLEDAYQNRDEVAFVTFAGEDADVLLPPTDSVTRAGRLLKDLPTGDRTPLPEGLRTTTTVLDRADPDAALVVVVTDGKANAGQQPVERTRAAADALRESAADVLVVDAGDGSELLAELVDRTDGDRVDLDALTATRIDAAVGSTNPE